MAVDIFYSSLGWVGLRLSNGLLCELVFGKRRRGEVEGVLGRAHGSGSAKDLVSDLKAYLKGCKVDFKGYSVASSQLTSFEEKVLCECGKIGYGKCCTYAELARSCGRPRAYRAVGSALAKNPTPIVVPCHRVLSQDGIGGYSQGLALKKALLKIEGII